jgi:hypothetical protein
MDIEKIKKEFKEIFLWLYKIFDNTKIKDKEIKLVNSCMNCNNIIYFYYGDDYYICIKHKILGKGSMICDDWNKKQIDYKNFTDKIKEINERVKLKKLSSCNNCIYGQKSFFLGMDNVMCENKKGETIGDKMVKPNNICKYWRGA